MARLNLPWPKTGLLNRALMRLLAGPTKLAWTAAGGFLLILAARLHIVARIGSAMPFWDEWDPDVIGMFLPPASGHPALRQIFAYHNEHLIALTRLLELGLFWAQNRQWHVVTNMVVNQMLYTGFAVAFLVMLGRGLGARSRLALALIGGAMLTNPFGWEAVSWAFESSIYLCVMLSIAALALLAKYRPSDGRFWLGILVTCLTVLAFGTGLATVVAAILLVATRQFGEESRLAAAVACGILGVILAAIVYNTPYGNDLHAQHAIGSLAAAAIRVLSWPRGRHSPFFVYLPAFVLLLCGIIGRRPRDTLFWFTAAICAWEYIVAAELAISRAEAPIVPRYTEIFVAGIVLNFACLFHLPRLQTHGHRVISAAAIGAWLLLLGSGAFSRLPALDGDLRNKRFQDDAQEYNVARYLRTGDMAYLRPPLPIPYHTPDMLALRLHSGEANRIFPKGLRDGDTPKHVKWRKTLNRYAEASALAGALLVLGALIAGRRRTLRRSEGRTSFLKKRSKRLLPVQIRASLTPHAKE